MDALAVTCYWKSSCFTTPIFCVYPDLPIESAVFLAGARGAIYRFEFPVPQTPGNVLCAMHQLRLPELAEYRFNSLTSTSSGVLLVIGVGDYPYPPTGHMLAIDPINLIVNQVAGSAHWLATDLSLQSGPSFADVTEFHVIESEQLAVMINCESANHYSVQVVTLPPQC